MNKDNFVATHPKTVVQYTMNISVKQPQKFTVIHYTRCIVIRQNCTISGNSYDNRRAFAHSYLELFLRISEQIFLRDFIRKPKYSLPETIISRGTTVLQKN